MNNFQFYLKNIRKSKNINQKTVANAINISEKTINQIEMADNNTLLQTSSSLLKDHVRKYCEYLEIEEKEIIFILNKLDMMYYKKFHYGKLKSFDYLNRFIISGIIIAIAVLLFQIIENNITVISSNPNNESLKLPIIYSYMDT